MICDDNVPAHPVVDITGDADNFRLRKRSSHLFLKSGLGYIDGRVLFAVSVDVVQNAIAVQNSQFGAGRHNADVRFEGTTQLVQLNTFAHGIHTFAFANVANFHNHIRQTFIVRDQYRCIVMGLFAAYVDIFGDLDLLLGRYSAGKSHATFDGAAVGNSHYLIAGECCHRCRFLSCLVGRGISIAAACSQQ